jgi:uncharacterized repeat protein (TIGR01451 family)
MPRGLGWLLVLALVAGVGLARATGVEQVTSDALEEQWSNRNTTTSQGKVLITDGTDVYFFDGSSVTLVQAQGSQGPESQGVVETGSLFVLGSGPTPGTVVGAWRRGTDYAWVWVYDGGAPPFPAPVLVLATNPTSPGQPQNPEGGAVDGGCVFVALQDGFCSAGNCRHVYQVDTTTGVATNLTGSAPVFGFMLPMTASRNQGACQGAWTFDDGSGTPKIHFYDGTAVAVADSGAAFGTHLGQGRLVYVKTDAGGVGQVMLYDGNLPAPAPVPLTADMTGQNDFARTDGRHLAWFHTEGSTRDVVLAGGLSLTAADPTSRPSASAFGEDALLLQRGQLLWQDAGGVLRLHDAQGPRALEIPPATSVSRPWLADGDVTWLGQSADGGADTEVFLFTGTPPSDAAQPAPPLVVQATPGSGQATVAWDGVLGATSYNLYLAEEPGVTSTNYPLLRGGRRITGVASPFVVTGLGDNRTFHFVVTALEGALEGPVSREAQATLPGAVSWIEVGGFGATPFNAVAGDRLQGDVAYAAGGGAGSHHTYKSTDGGFSWAPLGGLIDGADIRGIAADGPRVLAATRTGDMLRSTDGGGSWVTVVDGTDIGEQKKSLAVDPGDTNVVYAGDFQLGGGVGDYLIKSTDGGATWSQLPDTPLGEIRAYGLAVDAFGDVYAGGTGVTLVKSLDGGLTWSSIAPAPGYVWAAEVEAGQPASLFVGHSDFASTTHQVFKSTSHGASWAAAGSGQGLPTDQIVSLRIDPANPGYVHAGSYAGYAYSIDAGASWTLLNDGLTPQSVNALALTGSHRLIAATFAGLFLLDLTVPASADLGVSVSDAPDPVTVGGTLTYTLSVPDLGPDPASSVTLVDTLPAGVSFVSSNPPSPTCTLAGQTLTCGLGTVAIGAAATVTVVTTVTQAGVLTNTASVSGAEPDPDASNNTATATTTAGGAPTSADLAVGVSDSPDPVAVGAPLTYGIPVTNAGPDPASGVVLVVTLPASASFVSSIPPAPTCALAMPVLTCALGGLGAGGATNVSVVVTPTAPGTLTSSVSVSAGEPDPNPADNTATATTTATAALPVLSIGDVAVAEGNTGTSDAGFVVFLSGASADPVTVAYATASGTATSGIDFLPASGTLTLAPGTTSAPLSVAVVGDPLDEPDESFRVDLTSPTGATLGDAQGTGLILDDDGGVTLLRELVHGSGIVADLGAAPGPTADVDLYAIRQEPRSSHEILVDGTSGDIGSQGPLLELLAPGGATVLLGSLPAGAGSSRSLRFENAGAAAVADEYVRVKSAGCTTSCDPADVYRVSAFDTTCSLPRFNNSATQVTVVVLQNASADPVAGHLWFRDTAGLLLAQPSFSLGPHAALVLNTSSVAPGSSGSITVTSNARYGALAGKAVAVEPATGFTFDTALQPRPR